MSKVNTTRHCFSSATYCRYLTILNYDSEIGLDSYIIIICLNIKVYANFMYLTFQDLSFYCGIECAHSSRILHNNSISDRETNLSQVFAFGIIIIMIYHSVNLQEREFSSAFCWSCPSQCHRRLEGIVGVGHCSLEISVEKYQLFIYCQLVICVITQ